MYLLLTNLQKLSYEKELLEFYKKNPESSLKQLCDKEVELLLRDYPNGYNSDDYE